ncbi:MAG: HNH endonuclease [bacterium]
MIERVTESYLILPSLFLMDNSPSGAIATSDLIKKLFDIIKPSGEDLEILAGRTDTKFSQIVRNLRAHKTFEKYGYAEYENIQGLRHGVYKITNKGRAYLHENIDIVLYLLNNNFKSEDIENSFNIILSNKKQNKKIQIFDENIDINEGTNKVVVSKVYNRSNKLREFAIQNYTTGGRIKCGSCCFDFEEFYGDYGKGFIEIHHQKPVFMFEDEDLKKKIKDAISNVVPICPNCHRMIHKNRNNPLTIMQIKSHISKELSFCK